MTYPPITRGIPAFTSIWLGQLISGIGSGLTNFSLGVWVFQQTGSVTQFTLIALFSTLPGVVTLPLAGAVVDRWDRRRLMLFSNTGAALTTLAAAVLLFNGQLEVWHIYVGVAVRTVFSSFLSPAFSASTTLLVPKEHFGRTSGLVQANQASTQIIAPLLGGLLIASIKLRGVLLVDFVSYLAALASLLLVRIPAPTKAAGAVARGSLSHEAKYGLTFIRERRGLLALLIYFAAVNTIIASTTILFTPMVLGFSSPKVLGTILSVAGIGFLGGSVLMSVWGGPVDRLRGVLGFGALFGICSVIIGLTPTAAVVGIGTFGMYFVLPIINGCSQAIWQTKTPPDVQGRVFAVRRMIGASTVPFSYFIAGPLADKVFTPMLDGPFKSLTRVIGDGPGRGIGLMFIVGGISIALAQIGGYLYSPLRRVEADLPDALTDAALSRA